MTKDSNIYQFKITLQDTNPKIWRLIEVPENYNFQDLHIAIQDAMGWENCHPHEFEITNPKTKSKDIIGIPDYEKFETIVSGNKAKIISYFLLAQDKASYIYDFGDYWEHEVVLTKILPAEDAEYPRCIDGARNCPPENCGGVLEYEELLKVTKDPKHELYEYSLEWLGEEFDPEEFDSKSVIFR